MMNELDKDIKRLRKILDRVKKSNFWTNENIYKLIDLILVLELKKGCNIVKYHVVDSVRT